MTRYLGPFTSHEFGAAFDPVFSLEWALLPAVQLAHADAPDLLRAYVHTYLREEIQEKELVRRLAPYTRFLAIAGQLNGQVVNGQNLAREAGGYPVRAAAPRLPPQSQGTRTDPAEMVLV